MKLSQVASFETTGKSYFPATFFIQIHFIFHTFKPPQISQAIKISNLTLHFCHYFGNITASRFIVAHWALHYLTWRKCSHESRILMYLDDVSSAVTDPLFESESSESDSRSTPKNNTTFKHVISDTTL